MPRVKAPLCPNCKYPKAAGHGRTHYHLKALFRSIPRRKLHKGKIGSDYVTVAWFCPRCKFLIWDDSRVSA